MTTSFFIGIGAQNESLPIEDPAGNDVHRHGAAILLCLQADSLLRKDILGFKLDVERTRKKLHARLASVVIHKLGDPIGEVSDAGDDPAVQHPHTLSEASNCKGFDTAEKPIWYLVIFKK